MVWKYLFFALYLVLRQLMEASKKLHNSNQEDLQHVFQERIRLNGLQIVENNANGNCLFEAISDQLQIHNRVYSHQELRQMAVDELRRNPTTV